MKLEATGTLGFGEYSMSANGIDLLHVLAKHFDTNSGIVTGRITIEIIPLKKSCTVDGAQITKEADHETL